MCQRSRYESLAKRMRKSLKTRGGTSRWSTSMERLQLAGLVRDAAYTTEARAPSSASPAGAYHAAPAARLAGGLLPRRACSTAKL